MQRMIFFPVFGLLFSVIPLIITIWVLLKIQSIDSTLREISAKLDRLPRDQDKM